jgi:hypothetical protein
MLLDENHDEPGKIWVTTALNLNQQIRNPFLKSFLPWGAEEPTHSANIDKWRRFFLSNELSRMIERKNTGAASTCGAGVFPLMP